RDGIGKPQQLIGITVLNSFYVGRETVEVQLFESGRKSAFDQLNFSVGKGDTRVPVNEGPKTVEL
ncbi:MAG: hypothetical protein VW831_19400, partial [Gammaproteobacteria bacterium]